MPSKHSRQDLGQEGFAPSPTAAHSPASEENDYPVYNFAGFRFKPSQRRLERDGVSISIGGKALDLLTIFVSKPGEVISKAELLARLWENQVAEENSLRFHIATLRKVLGEGELITNVAGKGYAFVASVSRQAPGETVKSRIDSGFLPTPPRPLIGREDAVATLTTQLMERRFVTIVGAGGTGKTSVALTVAHRLIDHFSGDVCFFDVANQSGSKMLADSLALALKIPIQPIAATPQLAAFVRKRRLLLILDGCEPAVVDAAALAEELYRAASGVHLLTTSREALRAEGEHVYRLQPLPFPEEKAVTSANRALEFPSVRLFLERAQASNQDFSITDENARDIGAICRKLDGLALAIEFAAGRVQAQGVAEIARQLDTQFALLWPGRRTAVARHQTLRATLDWSHTLLSGAERMAWRRLSIFVGSFPLDIARQIICDETIVDAEANEILGDLVSKSLLQFKADGRHGLYRLLDTARTYALEKLEASGEQAKIASRHAQIVLGLLERHAERGGAGGMTSYDLMANVRAALTFSLHPDGDLQLAAAIANAAAPIWLQTRLLAECRYWTTRVLEMIDIDDLGPQRHLALQTALASGLIFTHGFTEQSYQSWLTTLSAARAAEDISQELYCLLVLWAHSIRSPDYREALSLALQAEGLVQRLGIDDQRPMTDWMVGISNHHIGNFTKGRELLTRSLAEDTIEARQAHINHTGYNRRIPSLGVLANALWAQGLADQAAQLSADALREARSSPYAVPLCEALTWHALLLYLRGDDPHGIDALAAECIEFAGFHFVESYQGLGMVLKGLNLLTTGQPEGAGLADEGLELLRHSSYKVFHPWVQTDVMRLRARQGDRFADHDVDALLLLEQYPEHWASAEVKRNLGEILMAQGRVEHARQLFTAAIALAQRQGALVWELRATLSLAMAEPGTALCEQALQRVRSLRGVFTEGFATADVQLADRMISAAG